MIDQVESRLRRIADAYAPDGRYLALLRILYGAWFITLSEDIAWTGSVPTPFFHAPPGLFFFLSGPPPEPIIVALAILKVVLGAMLIAGIWTLPVSISVSALLMFTSAVAYSYSKINHMILLELVPIFLAFAGWGCAYSVDALLRRRRNGSSEMHVRGMPILLFAMTVGWGLLSAAAPKIKNGWYDPSRDASRGYVAREVVRGERSGPLTHWALDVDSDLFWKLLDYATLAAEGCLILLVFFPFFFRLWLLVLGGFHIGVYLTLGINFFDYFLVYAVFFSPVFVWMVDRVRGSKPAPRQGVVEEFIAEANAPAP